MSAHIGITSTHGIVLTTGATAQSVKKTSTVEIAELIGVDGEFKKATPHHAKKVDVNIEAVGAIDFATVTSAVVVAPATLKLLNASQKQGNKDRPTLSLVYTGHEAFTDGAITATDSGAGSADEDTLGIVSTALALAESTGVGYEVADRLALTPAGVPGYRATCSKKGNFDVSGKGDLPAGLGLGTDGAVLADFTGGVIICSSTDEGQTMDNINDYAAKGMHYPVAVAA